MSKTPAKKTMKFEGPKLKKALDIVSLFAKSRKDPSIQFDDALLDDALEEVLRFTTLSYEKIFTNCTNSSMPPSQNPNRPKQSKKGTTKRKTGGQPGHPGSTMPLEDPDDEIECPVDMASLPPDHTYKEGGKEIRQVIELTCRRQVVHYHVHFVVDENGKRYFADCPQAKTRLQYGYTTVAQIIELSCYQMLPLERTSLYLREVFGISISEGTIVNWRTAVSKRLAAFDIWVRRKLLCSSVIHCDETGCNINGKQMWLHTVCNSQFFFFSVSKKRGTVAMDEIGILPAYKGVVTHDCFASYFLFLLCEHSICLAHILRELQGVIDREGYSWAKAMMKLLYEAIEAKEQSLALAIEKGLPLDATTDFGNGAVDKAIYLGFLRRFRYLLGVAETECGLNHKKLLKGSHELPAGTKTKNLVIRMKERESELLLFLRRGLVDATNNVAERALRMSKVHEKVSGCCRSITSAQDLARIRSYIYTCKAHGISCLEAMIALLEGKLPDFIKLDETLPELEIIEHKDEAS